MKRHPLFWDKSTQYLKSANSLYIYKFFVISVEIIKFYGARKPDKMVYMEKINIQGWLLIKLKKKSYDRAVILFDINTSTKSI